MHFPNHLYFSCGRGICLARLPFVPNLASVVEHGARIGLGASCSKATASFKASSCLAPPLASRIKAWHLSHAMHWQHSPLAQDVIKKLERQLECERQAHAVTRHWHHGSRLGICYVHGRGSEHLSDPQVLEETHMSGAIFLQEGFVRNDCGQRPRRVYFLTVSWRRLHRWLYANM